VSVPPLRDRAEDIPELVEYFLHQATMHDGSASSTVTPGALRLLSEYSWPGNVRELENLCRRAATLCSSNAIDADLIEPWLRATPSDEPDLGTLREGRMLEDMERQLIEKILARHSGHRVKTARALGMGVRTLGMKLKQWRDERQEHGRTLVSVTAEP